MACPNCGSWSVKADRSLAGRMVCGRCGLPLGARAGGRGQRRRPAARPARWGKGLAGWSPWGWGALLVVALAALLASQAPSTRSPGVQQERFPVAIP